MKLPQSLEKSIFKTDEGRQRFYNVVVPSFIVHAFAGLFGFGLIFVLTRSLGASNYGIYTYSISVVTLIVNIVTYGVNILAVRETSALLSQNKLALFKGLYKWSLSFLLKVCFILPCIIALVLASFTYYFHLISETIYTLPVLCALSLVPFFGFMNFYSALLRGAHRTVLSMLPDNVIKPLVFLALFVGGILVVGKLSVPLVILLNVAGLIAGGIYAFSGFNKIERLRIKDAPEMNTEKWKKDIGSFLVLAVITSVNSRLDILMLGFLKDSYSVGIYNSADRLAAFLATFLLIMNVVTSAPISRLNTLNEKEKLQRLITKVIRWVFVCTLPFYAVLVFFGKWILSHCFGPDFESGHYALILIGTAQLINIALGPVGIVSIMTGNERFNTVFGISNILINICLNLILTPIYGINGTAIATACTLVSWNLGMFISIRKKTGLRTWVLG